MLEDHQVRFRLTYYTPYVGAFISEILFNSINIIVVRLLAGNEIGPNTAGIFNTDMIGAPG
jgi:hypothetical protein